MCFPSTQSNKAMSSSVELLGQTTSPAHCQSCQSATWNDVSVQSVSVIVTVVIFQTLVAVTLSIQFHSGHSGHSGHSSHSGHCKVVFAFSIVTSVQSSLLKTKSSPTNPQLTIEAQSVPSCPSCQSAPSFQSCQSCQFCQGSPFSHFKLEYLAFLILLSSSLSAINIISSWAIVVFSSNHVGNINSAIFMFYKLNYAVALYLAYNHKLSILACVISIVLFQACMLIVCSVTVSVVGVASG